MKTTCLHSRALTKQSQTSNTTSGSHPFNLASPAHCLQPAPLQAPRRSQGHLCFPVPLQHTSCSCEVQGRRVRRCQDSLPGPCATGPEHHCSGGGGRTLIPSSSTPNCLGPGDPLESLSTPPPTAWLCLNSFRWEFLQTTDILGCIILVVVDRSVHL